MKKKFVSVRAAYSKHDYHTLENHTESFINEAISLTSIDESSVKLTRVGEPNNPYCTSQEMGIGRESR